MSECEADPTKPASGSRIEYRDPFADPAAQRSPVRRFRGRLASPVTVWTAGSRGHRTGLTVSSLVVAEGDPGNVIGLVGPLTDLVGALHDTGAFVVHLLAPGQHALAERFAGRHPFPGGVFAGLAVTESAHGPILDAVPSRLRCRLETDTPAGYSRLVRGRIDRAELGGETGALLWLGGRYQVLTDDDLRG